MNRIRTPARVTQPGRARAAVATPPFDPDLPEDGALVVAAVLRDQFNVLNGEISARATEAALNSAAASLNVDIQTRATVAQVTGDMNDAVNTAVATTLPQTSDNSYAVGNFGESASPSYDASQLQWLIDKLDELINTPRR